ncbi:bacteriocin immunity protein [Lonsdalea quercina]|uniref:bacteriocin immunity protein n=1 Tax=Lonsdalea quercina TaxID=71657 RepID=UPI003974C2B7
MTIIYQKLNDYTQDDFLQFVKDIVEANSSTEDEHYAWVHHFEKIVGHPSGNGIIYYPENGCDGTPEGIVEFVLEWRKSKGLPLFKDSK